MKARMLIAAMAMFGLIVAASINAEDKADPLAGLKCPVSGKKINPEAKVEYKEGHVYFCCEGCPGAFKDNTAKFATKANMQLVASGQYKEAACPIAGKKLNPATAINVGGVEVSFCCNGCKGKVEKAEGDAQLDLVFSDAAFAKGFEKAK
jgi:YHS domain-containing protein